MDPTVPNAAGSTTSVLEPSGDAGMGEKAAQVGQVAKEGAAEGMATVKQGVAAATNDMAGHAQQLFDQSRGHVRNEAQAQTEKLSQSLRQMGTQMHALANGRPEEAGPVADYARQAAESISRYAESIQSKGIDGVLRDTQDFARRRPGTFLLGALVAGVVVGRLVRNAKGIQHNGSSAPSPSFSNGLSQYPPPMAPITVVESPVSGYVTDAPGTWAANDPAGGVS